MINRTSTYGVSPILLNRWSPRAMSGKAVNNEQLMRLFEAASWAQSSYNGQPWRFIYAHRDTPAWQPIFDLMVSSNQSWAQNAGVLIVVISHSMFDHNGKPSITHSFDTGAACENLAIQGSIDGLVVHGIEGFNYANAKKVLQVPDTYTMEAMFAIGHPGNIHDLPEDLQKREVPSTRKPVNEFVFEGTFRIS